FAADRLESNNTSDRATRLGGLSRGTLALNDLTLHTAPLPDFDWYRLTAVTAGTFTAFLDIQQGQDMEVHVFTLSGNTLVRLGSSVFPQLVTQQVSVPVRAGQVLLVEVKARNTAPGVMAPGLYDLALTLA